MLQLKKVRAIHLLLLLVFGLVFAFAVVNIVACMHAKAMIEFSDSETRTQSPEKLGILSKLQVLALGVNIPRPENSQTPDDIGLNFESHQYKGSGNHTLEAWYIPSSAEETVVLLFHGYADSKDTLLPIADELHKLGHNTLLVDFYGSGGSTGNSTTIGYRESTDVSRSYRYAQQQWPDAKLVLYGYSMGGAAVLRAIATDSIEPDAIIVEATYDTMLNTVKNRFDSMGVPSTPLANLLVFWGGRLAGFNAFEHNPVDYAKLVSTPTLIIHGGKDPRVTEQQAASVHRQLRGWKKLSTYPLSGHKPVLLTDDSTGNDGPDYNARWREDISSLLHQSLVN